MSEFNYTKCSKPFSSVEEAKEFMTSKSFDGFILKRSDDTYTAVCPEYPEGYYKDAILIEEIKNESQCGC